MLSEQVLTELSHELIDFDQTKVPNYFIDDELSDKLLPTFVKGFRVDLANCDVSKTEYNTFIYECIVKPPGRADFFTTTNTPGRLKNFEVNVRLANKAPWQARLHSLTPEAKINIKKSVETKQGKDLIEHGFGPYACGVILVTKPSGKMEIAMNLATLNERTIRDVYPLPLIRDNLDALNNALVLSTIDICGAYLSIRIAETSRDFFAFITHCGFYRWKVLPYGFRNAGAIFCRVIASILNGFLYILMVSYVDDICIYGGRTFLDTLRCHNVIFNRLQDAGLRVSIQKCYFFMKEFVYLGFEISCEGVRPSKKNTEKLKDSKMETSADVRSFLRMAGFYRKWIQDYAKLTAPLYAWVKTKSPSLEVKKDAQAAASKIVARMITHPIMSYPRFEDHFYLETD